MRHVLVVSALLPALLAAPSFAQTTVSNAWVRGTVAQQKATGAFLDISSTDGGKLVAASSPAAGVVELHEMAMQGTTMTMRAVPSIDLPAGKSVALKPGGLHVMLMDLKAPLKAGDMVDLTLVVESRDGKRDNVAVKAPVRPLAAPAAAQQHQH